MRHRIHVYLGTIQCFVVIVGACCVSASVNHLEEILHEPDLLPLAPHRFLASYGGLFLVLPVLWIGLMIWAERRDLWWSSHRFVFASGLVLLVALGSLFAWSGIWTVSAPYR